MKTSRRLFIGILFAGFLAVSSVIWLTRSTIDSSDAFASITAGDIRELDGSNQMQTSPVAIRKGLNPSQISKLRDMARASSLHILDPTTLSVTSDAVKLMELRPEEVREINRLISGFTQKIFQAESSRAYVEMSAETGEVIVVPAFDRSAMLTSLKEEIAGITDKDMAKFIADRLAHDGVLGSTNTDIRVSIETDQAGVNRINYSRLVLKKNAESADIPLSVATMTPEMILNHRSGQKLDPNILDPSPTIRIKSSGLLRETMNLRIRHLFDAADKLPRKQK